MYVYDEANNLAKAIQERIVGMNIVKNAWKRWSIIQKITCIF